MNKVKLNKHLLFFIEKEKRQLRLVVSDDNAELVCRRTTHHELKKFIQSVNGHLFNGRLQMDRRDDHILISIKGNAAGIITLAEFEQMFAF